MQLRAFLKLSFCSKMQSPSYRPPLSPDLTSSRSEDWVFAYLVWAILKVRAACPAAAINHLTLAQLQPSTTRVMFMDLMLPGPYNEARPPPPSRFPALLQQLLDTILYSSSHATSSFGIL